MSKRKQRPGGDRRRPAIELNLLVDHDDSPGMFVRARRGCFLPFIGGGVVAALLPQLLTHIQH